MKIKHIVEIERPDITYNLHVKNEHNYILENGLVVSNCHQAKATEIGKVAERCIKAPWKIGFTGSLDDSKANEMQIRSLLGPVKRYTTTKGLMDDGLLAEIKIKCLSFRYSAETIKITKHLDYQSEIEFLVSHEKRNRFIRNLTISLDGNTLILYNLVEKHGQVLYDLIKAKAGDRPVFFVHGGVDAEDRDQVRHITEESSNAIIVASVGTFSTGTNIRRLNNIIFASPTKSVIRVLQSIGRGLRKIEGKEYCTLYDLSDKINNNKAKPNHTYRHYLARLGIYAKEQFTYKITEIPLE
jgi:superfamily II DNA or RNA helicase